MLKLLLKEQKDEIWKYWVINELLFKWESAPCDEIINELIRISKFPTADEIIEDIDASAKEYLNSISLNFNF